MSLDEDEYQRSREIITAAIGCGTTGELLWHDLLWMRERKPCQAERQTSSRSSEDEVNTPSV